MQQRFSDSSDEEDSGGGVGTRPLSHTAAINSNPASSVASGGKRRIIKRTKNTDGSTAENYPSNTKPSHVDPSGLLQIVGSQQEADALVKRLKQLEMENGTLANTLAKVCDENSSLTNILASMESKVTELAQEPLTRTSVLHSLFEPEKTGWFGGSKSAARDQLEKLTDALQTEYMEYKAAHASSNDEVQAVLAAMQAANVNAAEVARVVNEQQQTMSRGALAVTVRIVPVIDGDSLDGGVTVNELRDELRRQQQRTADVQAQLKQSHEEMRLRSNEVIKLQNDLKELREQARAITGGNGDKAGGGSAAAATATAAAASLKMEIELQKAKDEGGKLREELQQLRQALAAEEQLHNIKKAESAEVSKKLEAQRGAHREELTEVRRQLAESLEASMAGCPRCDDLRDELDDAKAAAEAAQRELQTLKAHVAQSASQSDTANASLQATLLQTQTTLTEKETLLKHSVPEGKYNELERTRKTLAHELELAEQRIATLEELNTGKIQKATAAAAGDEAGQGLSDAVVLDTLDRSKERVARAEFECEQLTEQLQQAQTYAVARDQEAQRLERSAAEDKQRVAFLIKKCANVTADLRTAATARDALAEESDRQKVEMKQLQRQAEAAAALQKKYDDLVKEKTQLEDRLSSAEELEEKLVKAKETIAYMELAQSRTINMSQYAELQASKDKLEHTVGPLTKRLTEANREIERLKSVTDAQQHVTGSQLSSVQNMQDQLTAATTSEGKLRDRVVALTAENDRLSKMNTSLEAQMTDMQDGIKEMAVQMENQRTAATTKAEANAQKQVADLKAQLDKARTELETVRATAGQFVAEGLYQNACADRDRLADENKKKGFEIEKMKSEILIYRQTIADLEAENDEHVKEIEALQDRYQTERATLSERLAKEQKKVAELSSAVDSLKEEVKTKSARLEQATQSVKDQQELNNKQKRAFEEKCTSEGKLSTQLAALQSTNVTLQSTYEQKLTEARAASPAPVPEATVAVQAPAPAAAPAPTVAPSPLSPSAEAAAAELGSLKNKVYQLQCDNDRLRGELRSTQMKARTEAEEDQRTIQFLQVQVKSRLPADARAAYDAEISKCAALRNCNEALLRENEQLKKQMSTAAAGGGTGPLAAYTAPTSALPSNAGELQAQMLQLQQQIAVQKSGFDAAMTHAIADAEAKQRQIEELEALLASQGGVGADDGHDDVSNTPTKNNSMAGTAGLDNDSLAVSTGADGGVSPQPKRKVKKIKRKKSLAEQVAAVDPSADVLATAAAAPEGGFVESASHSNHVVQPGLPPLAPAEADSTRQLMVQLRVTQADLLKAQRELELLRKENATLKGSVAQLTDDLNNAHDDLETLNTSMDEERADFEKRIYALEARLRAQADGSLVGRTASFSGVDTPANRSFSRHQSTQDAEMLLRSARDENEKLKLENQQLRNDLAKVQQQLQQAAGAGAVGGSQGPALSGAGAQELKKLRKAAQQKDAEIDSLAAELVPTKSKLVEYMAMADRLGLQYPFPPQLEGPTVMRLRSMNIQATNRATSAPLPAAAAEAAVPPGGQDGTRQHQPTSPRYGARGKAAAAAAAAAEDSSPAPRQPPGAVRRGAAQHARDYAPTAQSAFSSKEGFDDLR